MLVSTLMVSLAPPAGALAQERSTESQIERMIERAGDLLMIGIPAVSLSTTFILTDFRGSGQLFSGAAANVLVTEGLKRAIPRRRPDGSDEKSFPSGHTSIAFQGATFVHFRYGARYAVPAYAGAAFVAFSRVHAQKHFITDVVVGAALGTLSSRLFTDARDDDDPVAAANMGFGLQATFGGGLGWKLSGGVVNLAR